MKYWDALGPTLDSEARGLAGRLVTAFGERVQFWTLMGHAVIAQRMDDATVLGDLENPHDVVFPLHLLDMAFHGYLCRVPSIDRDEPQLARQIAMQLLAFVSGVRHRIAMFLPIGGVRVDGDELTVDEVRLRNLTAEEAGSRHPDLAMFRPVRPGQFLQPLPALTFDDETAVIEVRVTSPKTEPPQAPSSWSRLILAFQLSGFDIFGRGDGLWWLEPEWLSYGRQSGPAMLPKRGEREPKFVKSADLEAVLWLAKKLPSDEEMRTSSRRECVALRRSLLARSRVERGDALVDCVVALEAVLLPGIRDELKFRFALNGAKYLARDPGERQVIYQFLGDVYDLRSRLVHGRGRPPNAADIKDRLRRATELLTRALRQAVVEGWPSQEDFLELHLGGGCDG